MPDDDTFLALLADRPDDVDALGVYADWLEERADHARAQILRTQQRLAAAADRPARIEHARALVELAPTAPADWLARIAHPPLTGTCWEGSSDGKPITIRFLAGGTLNYTQYGATYQNGTWLQVGSAVACETNRHYADYTGAVADNIIVGVAHNIVNARWDWQVARTTDPAFVDVTGQVVTTVYDQHVKQHQKNAARPARKKATAAKKPAVKKPARKTESAAKKPAAKKPAARTRR